jgi:hypothetical protein
VDRHRFDAVPDRTFHFDADPDPDPDPTSIFTHIGKSEFFSHFYPQQCLFTLFLFLFGVIGVTIFNISENISLLQFYGKSLVQLYIRTKCTRIHKLST